MKIRRYEQQDIQACMRIFDSNCPHYFDIAERNMFYNWLLHQYNTEVTYSSPTYSNSAKDEYFIIENSASQIVGCGGYYVDLQSKEARLAWGMIHAAEQSNGFGTALFTFRKIKIRQDWPEMSICLGTSQHTFAFYEKMGMHVTAIENNGYGPDLDKYEMWEVGDFRL